MSDKEQATNEHHHQKFTIERHDIRLTFANWVDAYRVKHPDAKLPSVEEYTELFIKHLPKKCKQ